jgi:hypothetical protein
MYYTLCRLFLGMSVSYHHKHSLITLVVDDKFGTSSEHFHSGYADIFRLLGTCLNVYICTHIHM